MFASADLGEPCGVNGEDDLGRGYLECHWSRIAATASLC